MNTSMIQHLVRKDWYFNRLPMIGYTIAALAALALMSSSLDWGFNIGGIGLIIIVIAMGIHMIMLTVVNERTEHTLPFVMSLPVSSRDYTIAKMVANLGVFLLPWLVIVIASIGWILTRSWLPDGLLPFAIIMLLHMLLGYCLLLAVALISESLAWTVVAIVFNNIAIQAVMYISSNIPSIKQHLLTENIVWSPAAIALIVGHIGLIVCLLVLTITVQNRKRDFI